MEKNKAAGMLYAGGFVKFADLEIYRKTEQ
jgi:hypothetical protein